MPVMIIQFKTMKRQNPLCIILHTLHLLYIQTLIRFKKKYFYLFSLLGLMLLRRAKFLKYGLK